MYCSNCGKQNKKGAKFCVSCGTPLKEEGAEKPTPQVAVNVSQEDKRKTAKKPNKACAWLVVIFILIPVIFYVIANSGSQSQNMIIGIIGLAFIVFFLALVIQVIIKIIKTGFKSAIKSLIVIGVLGLIILGVYLSYRSYSYDNMVNDVSFIQDKETEIAAAKLLGDTLILDGAIPFDGVSMPEINSAVAAEKKRLNEASYPSELQSYVATINAWADKIIVARDVASWKALPEAPEKFEILVSDSWIRGLFEISYDDILAIKDAGDWAIQKKDRATMRFVAARLITIDHFLTSIETYQSVADSGLIESAYADYRTSSGAIMRTRKICFMNGKATVCLPEAKEATTKAKDVAKNLYRFVRPEGYTAVATSQSETGWDDAFGGVLPTADTPTGGAGISQGEPYVAPQFSPRVQAFRDSCRARGGNPDPTSIVKTRLPTTEDGYDCQIGGCWEFMTYSGRNYAGGGNGCPELGLVPKAPTPATNPFSNIIPNIIPNITPNVTPTTKSWDGSYLITTNVSCNVSGVGSVPIPLQSESITVSNGRFTDRNGKTISISSSGQAQSTFSASVTGASMQMVEKYQFYSEGGTVKVRGTMSLSGGGSDTINIPGVGNYGGSASIGCSGTISGSRR